MNDYLNKKQIPKALYIFFIITFSLLGAIRGSSLILESGIHYSSNLVGSSMEKTLFAGAKAIDIYANISPLKRGDIVRIEAYDENENLMFLVKRIVGLPNEKIKIKGSEVFINDKLLEEPYAYYSSESPDDLEMTIPNDSYFVIGDNRLGSWDSRNFGPIPKDLIIYKKLFFKNN